MNNSVTVIDYGMGNLFSIANAFKYCGAEVTFSSNPEEISSADRLVLPGVGAFENGMKELLARGLVDSIRRFTDKNRPFLGICLGMQMMFTESEEFGFHKGLDIISGKVRAIPTYGADNRYHKIPHIGWNNLLPSIGANWKGTILEGLPNSVMVYFVHSFTPVPDCDDDRLADTFYDGIMLAAVVKRGYLYGTQFHPEKSSKPGLQMIKKFIQA